MIVVPYTKVYQPTVDAVADARFVRVEGDHGYRNLLADLWSDGEAFTLVEHDVVPTRPQLDALDVCDEPWCFYGYYPGHWVPVFGCVRFSAALIAGTPDVWGDDAWPWDQLDMKFATEARSLGWKPHWHSPHVRHDGTMFVDADGETRSSLPDWLLHFTLDQEVARLREAIGASA